MIDESDISQERKWFYEQCASRVVDNLKKNKMNAQYVSSRQEALSAILDMIPAEAVVGRGDSVTLDQVGVTGELMKRNQNRIIDPFEKNADGSFPRVEQRRKVQREALLSDVFLTGTNAVTLDGKLVSTDGAGNRVAAMIFGPKKVIVVAGANKIVKDVNEALERIRTVAAPMNTKRHYLKHQIPELGDLPCVRTGRCADCKSDGRICNYTVIIEGATISEKGRINVVLVGEELGI